MNPARKVPLNYRNITGRIQSNKSNEYTIYESSLERDALILAEFDPDVLEFKTQPTIYYFDYNGKRRKYTPDILIEYRDGRKLIVEVKYREDIKKNWLTLKPKFKAAIRSVRNNWGERFKIWSEIEIRTQYLENAKFLLSYKNKPINEQQGCMILQVLDRMQTDLTPNEIISICSNDKMVQQEFLYSLWGVIAKGYARMDMTKPITMNSPVWLGKVYQTEDSKWHWEREPEWQP